MFIVVRRRSVVVVWWRTVRFMFWDWVKGTCDMVTVVRKREFRDSKLISTISNSRELNTHTWARAFPSSSPFAYPTRNPRTKDLLTLAWARDSPTQTASRQKDNLMEIVMALQFILFSSLGWEDEKRDWCRCHRHNPPKWEMRQTMSHMRERWLTRRYAVVRQLVLESKSICHWCRLHPFIRRNGRVNRVDVVSCLVSSDSLHVFIIQYRVSYTPFRSESDSDHESKSCLPFSLFISSDRYVTFSSVWLSNTYLCIMNWWRTWFFFSKNRFTFSFPLH